MKPRLYLPVICIFYSLLICPSNSNANSVLISSPHFWILGVGDPEQTLPGGVGNFAAALEIATGNQIFFADDFSNLSQMLGYDALLLQLRPMGSTLTSAEVSNLQSFLATGRRVLMIGDNNLYWADWNNSILNVVGGTNTSQTDSYLYLTAQSTVTNDITDGADIVFADYPGRSSGGFSFYDYDFAMFWGANKNALTVLDGNIFQNNTWDWENNSQFNTNVAVWLAGGPQAVPEPTSLLLLGTGIAGIGLATLLRRR